MPYILYELPFFPVDSLAFVGSEVIRVKAYEIVVWVSLGTRPEYSRDLPRFPAILDTAHTHHFSIQEEHLIRWTSLRPTRLALQGAIRQQGTRVPLRAARLWLHPNRPGERDQFLSRPAFQIYIPEGIAVYPAGSSFPRLPLLGLRAIARNGLVLKVDGKRLRVSLRTPRPWWWPFG